jgi:hypothetical protein
MQDQRIEGHEIQKAGTPQPEHQSTDTSEADGAKGPENCAQIPRPKSTEPTEHYHSQSADLEPSVPSAAVPEQGSTPIQVPLQGQNSPVSRKP